MTNSRTISPPSRLGSAIAGVSAAALGLGLAEVFAGLSRQLTSPVIAVGNRVVDNVPTAVKDLAIEWFGTNDKIALLAGIASILVMYSAVIGVVWFRKSRRISLAGIALFGIVGSWAALASRSGATWWSPLPSLAGAAGTAGALYGLSSLRYKWSGADDDQSIRALTPSDRRRFMASVGGVGAGAVGLAVFGRQLQGRFSAAGSRSTVGLPDPANKLDAVSDVASTGQAENAASFFTSNKDFYRIDTALTVPQLPVDTWNLRVHGMVDKEINLSFSDLLERELFEHDITLTCVSNTVGGELIGTARWLGIRLDDLLDEAGIDPAADQIVGRSSDGYTCGFPTRTLDGRDALVAIGMNGEPLPLEHGFPARLIVPGLYGYVSATKWLTEIELTTFDAFDHYWVPRGYAVEAPIKLQSRIDTPRGLDRIDPGPFVIGGVAWDQTVGIEAVELKVDDGEWVSATLADEINDVTWRQWSLPWDATPGRHSIEVRAINRDGAIQTSDRSEPLPDGADGHHNVVVLVNDAEPG